MFYYYGEVLTASIGPTNNKFEIELSVPHASKPVLEVKHCYVCLNPD